MILSASGNLVSSLNEHMKSKKHTTSTYKASHDTIVLRSVTVGRPKNPTNDKSQNFFTKFLIPSLPPPLHGVSSSSWDYGLGVLITQVII